MASYTYQQLKEAQERAEQAGDLEAAQELQAQAMAAAVRSGRRDSGFREDIANVGRGFASGIGRTVDSARGLWARLGNDQDSLQRINQSKEDRAARNAEYAARSPFAFGAGQLGGEIAATLPAGGVGGMAAKGALRVA